MIPAVNGYHACKDCKLLSIEDRLPYCNALENNVEIKNGILTWRQCNHFEEYVSKSASGGQETKPQETAVLSLGDKGLALDAKEIEKPVTGLERPKFILTKPATPIGMKEPGTADEYIAQFKNLKFLLDIAIEGAERANRLFEDIRVTLDNLADSALHYLVDHSQTELSDLFVDISDLSYNFQKVYVPAEEMVDISEAINDLLEIEDIWVDYLHDVLADKTVLTN